MLSEETRQGPWFFEQIGHNHPGGLGRYHQDWVEALARAAGTTGTADCKVAGSSGGRRTGPFLLEISINTKVARAFFPLGLMTRTTPSRPSRSTKSAMVTPGSGRSQ